MLVNFSKKREKVAFKQIRKEALRGEEGIYLVMVAGVLVALGIVVGFAIDAGTLYMAQINLQKAADAAAVAGAAQLAINEDDFCDETTFDSKVDPQSMKAASDVLLENLVHYGLSRDDLLNGNIIPTSATSFTPTWKFDAGGTTDLEIIPRVVRDGGCTSGVVNSATTKLQMRVEASFRQRLTVYSLLPGMAPDNVVRAIATADIKPAVVSLILDKSGSMNCQNLSPNADCTRDVVREAGTKLAFLKSGLNTEQDAFIRKLDKGRDYLNIISFNREAGVIYDSFPNHRNGGFDRVDDLVTCGTSGAANCAVNSIIAEGSTNPTDGFGVSYARTSNVLGLNDALEAAYVFFSDGAPTAVNLSLASKDAAGNDILSRAGGDYYYWTLNWGATVGARPQKFGVSALAQKFADNRNSITPCGENSNGSDNTIGKCGRTSCCGLRPVCSSVTEPGKGGGEEEVADSSRNPPIEVYETDLFPPYTKTRKPIVCEAGGTTTHAACSRVSPTLLQEETASDEIGACIPLAINGVGGLQFNINGTPYPKNLAHGFEQTLPNGTVVGPSGVEIARGDVNTYLYQMYTAPIAWADAMRANRGIWFGIGLGAPPGSIIPDDSPYRQLPYQGIEEPVERKDNFMQRITLDFGSINAITNFPGTDSVTGLAGNEAHQEGEYFPTPDAQRLGRIFSAIRTKIKLRLISSNPN